MSDNNYQPHNSREIYNRVKQEMQEKQKEREAKQRKKNRKNNLVILVVTSVLIVALIGILYFSAVLPEQKYQAAHLLRQESLYSEAESAYLQMSGYKESTGYASYCNAMQEISNGDITQAEIIIAELPDNIRTEIDKQLVAEIEKWEETAYTPDTVLKLLEISYLFDPQSQMDVTSIRLRVLQAIAGESDDVIYWYPLKTPNHIAAITSSNQLIYYSYTNTTITPLIKESILLLGDEIDATTTEYNGDEYIQLLSQTGYALYKCDMNTLSNIHFYAPAKTLEVNGSTLTVEQELSGSIDRSAIWKINLDDPTASVEGTIQWQEESYPVCASVYEAVQRYFEAYAYGITAECQTLTAVQLPVTSDAYESDLAILPQPKLPLSIEYQAYYVITEQMITLVRCSYTGKTGIVTALLAVSNQDEDGYKISACCMNSNQYLMNQENDIVCLNETTLLSDVINKDMLLIYIPDNAAMSMAIESGVQSTNQQASVALRNVDGTEVCNYSIAENSTTPAFYLTSGVYLLDVNNAEKLASTATLRMNAEKTDLSIEKEPNNSKNTATKLSIGENIHGAISYADDIDVYRFNVEGSAEVTTSFTLDDGTISASYILSILAIDDQQLLWQQRANGYDALSTVFLREGDYLFSVEPIDQTWAVSPYTLTLDARLDESSEGEPNDTLDTVCRLENGKTISATISYAGDIDLFSFVLDETANVTVQIGWEQSTAEETTYQLDIFQQMDLETPIWTTTIGNDDSEYTFSPLILPAGTHYLRIQQPTDEYAGQKYHINVIWLAEPMGEKEPNDEPMEINTLQADSYVIGCISNEDDRDRYIFTLDRDSYIQLCLRYEASSNKNRLYYLCVYNQTSPYKSIWSDSTYSNVGENKMKVLTLDAGTYYVEVSAYSKWDARLYNLELLVQVK